FELPKLNRNSSIDSLLNQEIMV
ncbi:hypothetical protein, partial [Acinetobacter baumannii]